MNDLEFFKNISLIIASLTAVYGITSWRREFVGRRRIELAEDVLASFYEARDAIATIRSPMGYSGEGSSREPGENESPEEKKAYDQAYVVIERYNKHKELFNKIQSMRYRFIAQFGANSAKPFNGLNEIVHEIFLASNMLADLWKRQSRVPAAMDIPPGLQDAIREHEKIFWGWGGKSDPIFPRVDAAVHEIEEICQNVINPESWHVNFFKKIRDPFEPGFPR